ncbi:hypothetical protein TRFO_03936 [Tritrichomonas foetus]|uniref:BRCT domain-containing protein n=1 Tax=Tritrichomonas foetus TaxID=1144522 RepID=A0A1J4KKD5_9EUKA|nr:hypothetical protein TRFO_03936 [Tritrichomonas foetus]|eukprot:OHT11691.1 hypothetical protein TRFO_03936 [Tritrichomonas foetus]
MRSVFLSSSICSKKKEETEQIIQSFGGRVIKNGEPHNLKIISDHELPGPISTRIPTITVFCLKCMFAKQIDPFDFSYKNGFLRNLFLLNQSFMFYDVCDENKALYTSLVESMGGIMKSEKADFCLTEKKEKLPIKSLVSIGWIFALQYSFEYMKPDRFSLYQGNNSSSQMKMRPSSLSQRTPILGQLDLVLMDSHSQNIPRASQHQTKPKISILQKTDSKLKSQKLNHIRKTGKTPILNGKLMIVYDNDEKENQTPRYSFKYSHSIENVKSQINTIPKIDEKYKQPKTPITITQNLHQSSFEVNIKHENIQCNSISSQTNRFPKSDDHLSPINLNKTDGKQCSEFRNIDKNINILSRKENPSPRKSQRNNIDIDELSDNFDIPFMCPSPEGGPLNQVDVTEVKNAANLIMRNSSIKNKPKIQSVNNQKKIAYEELNEFSQVFTHDDASEEKEVRYDMAPRKIIESSFSASQDPFLLQLL